jgi:hypothetical protein
MAKKRSRKVGGRTRKPRKGKRSKLPKGFPRKAGTKAKAKEKVRTLTVKKGVDVWQLQNALRKDKYFARAVGPSKVATNAPIRKI